MNSLLRIGAFALVLANLLTPLQASAQDRFYYWMGSRYGGVGTGGETFVIEVTGALKTQIDELLAKGHSVGVDGRIAAGSADYNKNYNEPGQPTWNWHFVSIEGLRDFTEFPYDTTEINPNRDSRPSDIAADPAAWIRDHGDSYYPKDYAIWRQIDPSKKDAFVNVSNRGMAGAGEKALITGLIIKGGEPRNVLIRALGPSMKGGGVQQAATNPRVDVFTNSGTRIAGNDDWKLHGRSGTLARSYPAMAPGDDREAALLVTLVPGTYTIHGTNEDGTDGVLLLEAYDIDAE